MHSSISPLLGSSLQETRLSSERPYIQLLLQQVKYTVKFSTFRIMYHNLGGFEGVNMFPPRMRTCL